MKTNLELRGALNMVLARLDAEPVSVAEWTIIRDALRDAQAYANKVIDLHVQLSNRELGK